MTSRTPSYATAAEFLAAHPKCCRISSEFHREMPPVSRGEAGITNVTVDFEVRATLRDGSERPIIARTNIAIDGCGRRYDDYAFVRIGRTDWFD